MRALLFAYAISTLPSLAPNSRRDNVLQLPTKNFAKKTKLYAFAMQHGLRHANFLRSGAVQLASTTLGQFQYLDLADANLAAGIVLLKGEMAFLESLGEVEILE